MAAGIRVLWLEFWSWNSGAGIPELDFWSWNSGVGIPELEVWSQNSELHATLTPSSSAAPHKFLGFSTARTRVPWTSKFLTPKSLPATPRRILHLRQSLILK